MALVASIAVTARSAGRRRTWAQRLVIAANILLVFVCLGSAGALAFYNKQLADVPRVSLGSTLDKQTSTAEPQNFLLVGADNSVGLDPNDPVVAGRNVNEMLTDTIMILRVDPNQEKAWLLSLPRDLYVPIPGHGKDRINAALAFGGPQLLIETIKSNFDIPINHFIQVNFFGFKQLVDSVGGVPIYFNHPARDANTGLAVFETGCQVLDGDQALAFARSRHYTAQIDGVWQEDPTSDHGRIARQQYFVKQAMKRAIEKGARNPIQMAGLIDVAKQYVVLDDTLTPEQLLDLGSRFNEFNPDDLEVFEPYTRGGWAGPASVLFLEEAPSQAMFNIFRGIDPTLNVNAAVRTEVRNGTGKADGAAEAADELRKAGFTITGAVDDKSFRNDRTVITYAPGAKLAAVVVARYLDIDPELVEEPELAGTDTLVALVVGKDFTGVRKEPRPIEEFQHYLDEAGTTTTAPAGATPSTTAPAPTQPGVTATTAPPAPSENSFVPDPPDGVEC